MQTQETKLNEEKEKKKILSDATYVLERIDSILPKIEEISSDVLQISKWGQKLEQMNASFKKQIYEDVVRNITQLQKQISESAHMSAKDLDIDPLLELHHVCQVIQLTPWKNLFDAAKQLFDHYHQSTLVKLREAFKVLISHMKWPRLRVMSSHTLPKSNQDINPEQMAESAESTKESFQIVLEKLLRLDPGVLKATKFEDVKDIHLIAFNDLMAPLEIRFQHHFEGTRKTNNIRKPEWYLTFTMDTIQDHLEFLLSNVHPIMVANIPYFYDAQTEFVRRMVFLVDRKLSRDLNLLMQNPAALLHTFEEIGQFEKDIAKIYDIPNEILTCMSVFTRDEEVWKFLLDTLREDYTTRFINDLEKVESWKMKFIQQQSVDEFKRAAIADILVINLKQLEDVTTCLSSASLKFQVANIVQNELLCSFTQKVLSRNSEHHSRLSSSQDPALSSELLKDICTSVNSAYYVEQILRDWENKELYIEIADYAKSRHPLLQPAEEGSHSGVFHHHISALSEVQAKGLELIRSHVATQFSIRSKSYFKRTVWSRADLGAHLVSDELVPSGEVCGMLAFLQQQFRTLEAILHPDLLRSTVRSVFRVVDKYIFEKTVDYFTLKLGQAAQFEVDMKAILEFSTHHHSTSETFLRLRGILRLISLSSNAFRELEQIVRQRNEALVKEALENLDMNDMNPSDVQEILDKIVVEEEKESQLT
eukprot:TRINITY_DN1294_c0_g2_i1.p1 TRINITY_DN1294_c0_g2~~TRINITY_DN1294_c0_g2_i1.p1  ORF type:complete len:706 (+),score=157.20 TRINITY_DN1294_c0_g2_i1:105-2222(+)